MGPLLILDSLKRIKNLLKKKNNIKQFSANAVKLNSFI